MRSSLLSSVLAGMPMAGFAPRDAGDVVPRRRPVAKLAERNVEEGLYDAAEGLLKRGPRDEKTLVLTFDDGPHPESSEAPARRPEGAST